MQDVVLELLDAVVQKLPDKCRHCVLHCGDDVAAAARTGRVIDLHSIAESAAAGVYECTADPINAAAEDIRAVAAVLRAAMRRGVVPLDDAFDNAGEEVADTLEATWDAAVAERKSGGLGVADGGSKEMEEPVASQTFSALRAQLAEQWQVKERQHVEWSTAAQRTAEMEPFAGKKVANAASTEALLSFEALAKEVTKTHLGCAPAVY
jgi:hypothetical protein